MAMKKLNKPAPVEDEEETGTSMVPWEEKMKELATEGAKMERSGSGLISLRNGVMQYMGEPVPNNRLQVVVLGSSVEHSYYDVKYDPDLVVPPRCFAVGAVNATMRPHEDVPEDQRQAETCAACWAHAFKSADNGRGRACSVRRRLALIPANALEDMETLPSAEVAMLKVPPTSVQNYAKYVNLLAAKHQRPPFGVVTELILKPHPKFQYMLHFEDVGIIDADDVGPLYAMSQSVEASLMAPFDMTPPAEEEEPEPPKRPGKPAPKRKF